MSRAYTAMTDRRATLLARVLRVAESVADDNPMSVKCEGLKAAIVSLRDEMESTGVDVKRPWFHVTRHWLVNILDEENVL